MVSNPNVWSTSACDTVISTKGFATNLYSVCNCILLETCARQTTIPDKFAKKPVISNGLRFDT
jgi:hypothetical protein